jgi:3-oxoacyl-[acyl-carrier protein] reductase
MSDGCALVTGGSRGIGAAIALALAEDGWPVAVNYRTGQEAAEQIAKKIEEAGGTAMTVQADVSEHDGAKLYEQIEEKLGPVLCLVNNAGVRADGLSPQLTDEEWDGVLATNLTGAFRMTRRALKTMMRARYGRIVNISSIVGLKANPGQANYAAAKGGLIAFTKTVAAEVARRGVTVNAVAPGLIATDMTEDVGEQMLEHVPARRVGTPEDVAACVRFLASESAGYVTGTTLTVDGGLTA